MSLSAPAIPDPYGDGSSSPEPDTIDPARIEEIAASPRLDGIEALRIWAQPRDIARVVASPHLVRLRSLALARVDASCLGAITRSLSRAPLRELELADGSLGIDALRELGGGALARLDVLMLTACIATCDEMRVLAASIAHQPALRRLGVHHAPLGREGAQLLAYARGIEGLDRLELFHDRLGVEGAGVLASASLRGVLAVSLLDVGAEGLDAIAASRTLGGLAVINVGSLDREGPLVQRLRARFGRRLELDA